MKAFIFVELGIFGGKFLANFYHYKRYPKFYEMLSGQWYAEILYSTLITAIIVAVSLVEYIIPGRVIKKNEHNEDNQVKEPKNTV